MIYGAEVRTNQGVCYIFELKTKIDVMKRLEKWGIANLIYTGYSWKIVPINKNQFVIYCRLESKNIYDKTAYRKLEGNYRGSWEF